MRLPVQAGISLAPSVSFRFPVMHFFPTGRACAARPFVCVGVRAGRARPAWRKRRRRQEERRAGVPPRGGAAGASASTERLGEICASGEGRPKRGLPWQPSAPAVGLNGAASASASSSSSSCCCQTAQSSPRRLLGVKRPASPPPPTPEEPLWLCRSPFGGTKKRDSAAPEAKRESWSGCSPFRAGLPTPFGCDVGKGDGVERAFALSNGKGFRPSGSSPRTKPHPWIKFSGRVGRRFGGGNMNRYLPVARQHFLAVLASTSVVVKSLCAIVILLYLLSFAVDTVFGLGVTPGYLFPPNFWIWTLATHSLVEKHIWDVGVSLGTIVVAGRLLEPLWGALELLIFFAVVNISVGLLGALAYLLTYMATFSLPYLFSVRIYGMLGFLGGVLVALKQTMGDGTVLKIPQVRMKVVPMLLLLILSALRLTTLIESNILASYGFGVLSSWIYLRFYQRHSRGRGDMSDHFAFATFFPEILQPVVGLLANLVHTILVKVRVCRKTVKRYDVGAPSSITISLPGTDPQDAERRRQLALKALNERLKRVEDQSAWPSMEDEDEENTKADAPLLPEKSRDSASVGKASSQESSLITFEDAPSQL